MAEDTDGQSSPAESQFSDVSSLSAFQLPLFWKARVETQFRLNRIVKDDIMFGKVIGEIDPDMLSQVADIIESSPEFDKHLIIE